MLKPAPALNAKETEVLTITGQAITKYMQETVTKFILGEKSFDEWDKYVSEVKRLGLDSYLKIYTDAYDRVLKTKYYWVPDVSLLSSGTFFYELIRKYKFFGVEPKVPLYCELIRKYKFLG